MKIFGWISTKLHLGATEYHRIAHRNSPGTCDFSDVVVCEESGRKGGTLFGTREKETDMEALLLLTIGTLGHHSNPHQQQQIQELELPADFEDELKQTALQDLTVAKPTALALIHSSNSKIFKPESLVEQSVKQETVLMIEEEIKNQEPLLKEDRDKREKRTTLADLIAAEPGYATGALRNAMSVDDKWQTTTFPTKNVFQESKKGGQEYLPNSVTATTKIHRLITRMLKKKIHPDLTRGEERHSRRAASNGREEGKGGCLLPQG